MSATYLPGDGAVVVDRHAVVMAGTDRAAELSRVLDGSPTPLGVLSILSGGDVARLPEFAAVVVDGDDLVVMVRGDYRVRRGEQEWSGADVATWREHRVAVTDDDVVISHGGPEADVELPIGVGVVLAGQVAWRPEASAVMEPGAAGADVSQPAVPPEPALTPVPTPAPDPEFTRVEPEEDFDEVVGATVQGQRAPAPETGASGAGAAEGDHDGRTITTAQVQQLREGRTPEDAPSSSEPTATLMMSDGEVVDLGQPVVIGRSPRAAQMSSSRLPRLVVVDDPYVSGTHLEVTVEDGAVVAVDRSTNGTTLTRPDQEPQRLAKDEPTVLGDGCVLGLSEDVTATVTLRGTGT